jgi:hypothetical protein
MGAYSTFKGTLNAPSITSRLAFEILTHSHRDGTDLYRSPRLERDHPMPFSKHVPEPEHIEAMRAAFHKVCDALLLKCDVDDPMTEIVVNKIVAHAKAGGHDANRLAELVLNDLIDDGQAAAS